MLDVMVRKQQDRRTFLQQVGMMGLAAALPAAVASAETADVKAVSYTHLGRFNTKAEVDYVADKLIDVVLKLRELSPLYEMVKEGIDLTKIEWAAH